MCEHPHIIGKSKAHYHLHIGEHTVEFKKYFKTPTIGKLIEINGKDFKKCLEFKH